MAKKKSKLKNNETATDNQQIHNQIDQNATTVLSRNSSMEDHDSSEEIVQKLKTLNEMLLKQTMENRQQIESLVQSKDELKTELTRYDSELGQVSDENLGLKIELDVVMDFVENRFREMSVGVDRLMSEKSDEIRLLKEEKDEIEKEQLMKVCVERDSIKNEFELQSEELNRLKEKESENERLVKEMKNQEEAITGLKRKLDESMEKESVMIMQIVTLEEEKAIKESEKQSVEKQIEIQSKLIEQLSQEKIMLEVREAVLFQNANDLTRVIEAVQLDCNELSMTNDSLNSEISQLSDALACVEAEREEADKALDEEKRHGEDLKAEVIESKKMFESTLDELKNIKIERENLKTEKSILEKELVKFKKELKTAASTLCQSENREDRSAMELESIEKAFKIKEDIIEEMKKEAETMKQSTEEAHKKQSFWTLVSSVTTVFAAASFAYAARNR